jgi:hypothetical protein
MHLVDLHGSRDASLEAREGLRDALENRHWLDEGEVRRSRYWHSIMREIERLTGYGHQPDVSTRHPKS